MSNGRSVPGGTIAVLVGLATAGATGYGYLLFAAHALGPEGYGVLSTLWFLVAMVGTGFFLPLEQALSASVAARRAHHVGERPVVVRSLVAGGVLLLFLLVGTTLLAPWLSSILFAGNRWLVLAFCLALTGYFAEHAARGVFAGSRRFRRYGALLGIEGVARLAGAALLGLAGPIELAPLALVLGLAPMTATLLSLTPRRLRLLPGPHARWSEISRSMGYLLISSVLIQVLLNAPPVVVGALSGADERVDVGRFNAALLVARLPVFLFAALQATLLPRFAASAAAEGTARLREEIRHAISMVLLFGGLSTIAEIAAGPLALSVLFGPEFRLGHTHFAYLASAGAAYMGATALGQAMIALNALRSFTLSWTVALVAFVAIAALGDDPVTRVETALLGASIAACLMMALQLRGWETRRQCSTA